MKGTETSRKKDWPHAPTHRLDSRGVYMVTARTLHMKHGLVRVANQYPWCSAAWFERTASPATVKTIYGFKTDKLQIEDDF